MISVVVTANGRLDLLKRTLMSFYKYNTYPIKEFIIIDDSGDINKISFPGVTMIYNSPKIGQIPSIDKAYSYVTTPLVFHLEEDWEFYRSGFIEKSLEILEDENILTVWLREHGDTNGHGIEKVNGIELMKVNELGGIWHGFTWNPGLRRMKDYHLVAPFTDFIQPNDFNALTECRIGQRYYELGFRAAILPEGYVKHIG